MAYQVNQTNGTLLATVLDGAVDRTHAGIALIGKQVTNYGEIQNENFVRLAENFSNADAPLAPLEGQIWWNSTVKTMYVYGGDNWRSLSGLTSAATAPSSPYVSDRWWDTVNQQCYIWTGAEWVLIGPAYSVLDGKTGALVEYIWDTTATKHVVTKLYNNNVVTAIISKDATFTPNVTVSGFSTISPGINLSTAITNNRFTGTATNADQLDNLDSTQFIRSDIDQVSTGKLSIHNQLEVGATNDLNISATSGDVTISNATADKSIAFKVSPASVLTSALVIDGATGLVTVDLDPTTARGVVSKNYSDTVTTTLRNDTVSYITANVATINASISALSASVDAKEAQIYNLLAPKLSPTFTGTPATPTAAPGTNTTQVASTAFVTNAIDAIDKSIIYNSNNSVQVTGSSVVTVINATPISVATATGITTITQAANNNSTNIATTAYADRGDKNFVLGAVNYQPTCYVSSVAPSNSQGVDGDFWYQYI